jgi:hypothetical protein
MILDNPFAVSSPELFLGIRLTPLAHFVPIHTVKMRVVVFFVDGFSNLFKDFNFVGGRNLGGGGGVRQQRRQNKRRQHPQELFHLLCFLN